MDPTSNRPRPKMTLDEKMTLLDKGERGPADNNGLTPPRIRGKVLRTMKLLGASPRHRTDGKTTPRPQSRNDSAQGDGVGTKSGVASACSGQESDHQLTTSPSRQKTFHSSTSTTSARTSVYSRSTQINPSLFVNTSLTDSLLDLIEAAECGDVAALHELMSRTNPSVSFKRLGGEVRTPLHRSCGYGQLGAVREMIESGADINATTPSGRGLLHEACIGGHHNVVQYLIGMGLSVNQQDSSGQTPAHLAAYHGELLCLQKLVISGASVDMEDVKKKKVCHMAAERDQHEILRFLHGKGFNLEERDEKNKTPAHYAAEHGGLDTLAFMASIDVDLFARDRTGMVPAHYAAASNSVDCMRFLVKQETAPTVRDSKGRNLGHLAACHGSTGVLHWLLEKNLNPNIQDNSGNTIGHYAAKWGYPQCFNCYLQHGGRLDIVNTSSDIPIQSARKNGHPVIMGSAIRNDVKCRFCVQKYRFVLWESSHQPSRVERQVASGKHVIYKSPINKARRPQSNMDKNKPVRDKLLTPRMPVRDLATRFYGEHNIPMTL